MSSGQDVNATAVVEKPLTVVPRPSFFNYLTSSAKSKPEKPVSRASEPAITLRDFAGYISLLRKARRDAGLPEEEGSDISMQSTSNGAGDDAAALLSSSRWRGTGISTCAPAGDAFDVVPPYFFKREFRLSDPAVMREVFQPGKTLDELQDGLSVLLDTVECQLLGSIKARSRQFFEALSSLNELRDRVLDGNIAATALRRQLERVRDESCLQPLSIIILQRRRGRADSMRTLVAHMRRAAAAPVAAAALYNSGDWMGALDVIRQTTALMRLHLQGVHSVAGIERRLDDFGRMIASEISEKFSSEAIAVVVMGDTNVPLEDAGAGNSASPSSSSYGESAHSPASSLETALQVRVRSAADGLIRTARLGQALDKLQGVLISEIKEFVRTDVDEAVCAELRALDPPAGQGSRETRVVVTAESIQALPPDTFLRVFTSVTARILELVARLQGLHDFLERCLDAQGRPEWMPSAAPGQGQGRGSGVRNREVGGGSSSLSSQVSDWEGNVSGWRAQAGALVAVGVDSASRNLARLLGLRRDVSARIKLHDLRKLWDACTQYSHSAQVLLTQSMLGGGVHVSPPLSCIMVQSECMDHARAWIAHAREKNVGSLSQLLDAETWRQADVPGTVQAVASAIEGALTSSTSAAGVQVAQAAAGSSGSNSDGSTASDTLLVGGQRYPIVASGIMLVKMLSDYAGSCEALPELAPEGIAATAELLREFNSRATSLVLGAGAIATAALKKITAKHLALTLQTLSAVLALLPSVRALLLMRLPPSQHALLSDLAAVTADILSHENRIRAKFVAIVKDLLVKSTSDMRGLPWGRPDSAPAAFFPAPCPPLLDLSKGVMTLHRILAGVLRTEQLEDITSRVLVMVNSYLPGQVQAIMSHSALAAQGAGGGAFSRDLLMSRLGHDVAFLLRDLDGLLPYDQPSPSGSTPSAPMAAPAAPGVDALKSLTKWATATFGQLQLPPRLADTHVQVDAAAIVPARPTRLSEGVEDVSSSSAVRTVAEEAQAGELQFEGHGAAAYVEEGEGEEANVSTDAGMQDVPRVEEGLSMAVPEVAEEVVARAESSAAMIDAGKPMVSRVVRFPLDSRS